jgi:hypothetical protein
MSRGADTARIERALSPSGAAVALGVPQSERPELVDQLSRDPLSFRIL